MEDVGIYLDVQKWREVARKQKKTGGLEGMDEEVDEGELKKEKPKFSVREIEREKRGGRKERKKEKNYI